jgi:hypothetical protein
MKNQTVCLILLLALLAGAMLIVDSEDWGKDFPGITRVAPPAPVRVAPEQVTIGTLPN